MKRIVIAEDEKMIRQGIKVMVQRSGIEIEEIIECKNGLEALQVINEKKVDVMITDIRMPKMDGITLMKEISKLEDKPKVIVISGYDDFSYAVELLRSGAREYLLKPVEREKLAHALQLLENEVKAEEDQDKHEKEKVEYLFYSHLKLFFSLPTAAHIKMLKMEGGEWLEKNKYWVYCSGHKALNDYALSDTVYLDNINGQDFFIVINKEEKKKLEEHLEEMCFGVSETHQGVSELLEAYNEVWEARKKAFYSVHSRKVSQENLAHYIDHEKEELIDHITQLIGTERIKEAIKLLEMYEYKLQLGEVSIEVFERFMDDLLNKIKSTYRNVIDVENNETEVKHLYSYKNVEEYVEIISEFFVEIHEKIIGEFEDYKSKQKIQEALRYIKENYHKDLNMAVVSNHISMNYSLFSLAFKKYTGMNFVNYIKDLRINEAKKLLGNTDKKINEISASVGYENEKHFMKIFKTMHGVSPTEYRKNIQIGNAKKSDKQKDR